MDNYELEKLDQDQSNQSKSQQINMMKIAEQKTWEGHNVNSKFYLQISFRKKVNHYVDM